MIRPSQLLPRALILAYAGILCAIIMAGLDLFNTSWPFELFASYMRHAMLALPFAAAVSFWQWRRVIVPLLLMAIWAFWPILSFSQYVKPGGADCAVQTCLSVLSANIQGNLTAFDVTADRASQQGADLITLLEIPPSLTAAQIGQRFSQTPYVIMLSKTQDGTTRRMRLAILSRYPLSHLSGVPLPKGVHEISGPRFIPAQLQMPGVAPVQIIGLHPYPPISPRMAWGRDQTLKEAIAVLNPQSPFIIMGDFNTTPWTPAFKALPGRRAGDPRFISTWDATRPWMGIPIDHILISDDIKLGAAKRELSTGSDHYPITATLVIK